MKLLSFFKKGFINKSAYVLLKETIKEVFIEIVRIDNGYTREEFEMLAPSKIEELLKDPILIKFIINNEKNITLNKVEEAIKRWKK